METDFIHELENPKKKKIITLQMKNAYRQKEEAFKEELARIKDHIKKMEDEIKVSTDNYNDYRQIAIANEHLAMVTLYINITEDMETLKGVKHESYLNEGRKAFYNVLLSLEKVFTDFIPLEPTEIQKKADSIPKFDPARKIILFRKIIFILNNLEKGFGEKSKYRWAFADMFVRFAIIFKNAMNIKDLTTRDPRKPFFEENEILTNMLFDVLSRSSDKLREKYEISTKKVIDMSNALKILEELRRYFVLFKETASAEETKKKIDVWEDKLQKDMKTNEKLSLGVKKEEKKQRLSLDETMKKAQEALRKKGKK
ncbi:MAG TPA: hypothetical protein DHW82_06760 [Spirochaetia bacterium]|nr:MAG: hypothetical protein A2Y41_10815 [Spirochaetes bacterium GWB1_36_13]HCL56695.1 hypothetical protein [Spirochaetia bacterium]